MTDNAKKKMDLAEFIRQHCSREGIKNVLFTFVDEQTGFTYVQFERGPGDSGDHIQEIALSISKMSAVKPEINPNQLEIEFNESR